MVPTTKRIALIIPHTDTTLETDLQRGLPEGYVLHTSRIWLDEVGEAAEKRMVDEMLPGGINALQGIAEFDCAVFGCTSASAIYGRQGLERLEASLADAFGCPAVSAFGAVLGDIEKRGNPALALLTPYTRAVNRIMAASLAEFGIRVACHSGLGITDDIQIAAVPPDSIVDMVRQNKEEIVSKGEALLLSCTNLRAREVCEILEEELHINVFSSNRSILNWINEDK